MKELIIYIATLLLVYLMYLFLIILRKKKNVDYKNSTEFKYLMMKYKLNMTNINITKLMHVLAFANAFIISTTVLIISYIDSYVYKMLTGFIILIPMCLIIYHIIGRYYQKQERRKKNV